MKFAELQKLYLRICCACTIINLNDVVYFIYDPSSGDQLLGVHYYEQVYDTLVTNGVMTETQCELLLKQKGQWSVEEDDKIKTLQDNLEKLNIRLGELEFKSTEKKSVLNYIDLTKAELNRLAHKKQSLLVNSAEYIAKLETYKYYLFLLTFDQNKKRMWTDWKTFCDLPNTFVSYLITKAYVDNDLIETNIRRLARNEPWRSTWLLASKTGRLFDRAAQDITDYQRNLVTWSIIYDNALEHPDSPSTEIMENDLLFDQWLETQSRKRREAAGKKSEDFITNTNIRNSQEIGIVVDSIEDAKKVFDLNDSNAKSIIRSRDAKLKTEGTVSEVHMPDVKQRLQLLINNNMMEVGRGS